VCEPGDAINLLGKCKPCPYGYTSDGGDALDGADQPLCVEEEEFLNGEADGEGGGKHGGGGEGKESDKGAGVEGEAGAYEGKGSKPKMYTTEDLEGEATDGR
jgi:hypothetical protein